MSEMYSQLLDQLNIQDTTILRLSEELKIEKALNLEISVLESGYIKAIQNQAEHIRETEEERDAQYARFNALLDWHEKEAGAMADDIKSLRADVLFYAKATRIVVEEAKEENLCGAPSNGWGE